MRRSTRLLSTLQSLGFALRTVAKAAQAASDLDRAAVANAFEALDLANQWRKDTTETARRHAYGAACKCFALARAPIPPESPQSARARDALAIFASALFSALEGDHETAVRVGDSAAQAARLG